MRTLVIVASLALAVTAADARPRTHHAHRGHHAQQAKPQCFLFLCPNATAQQPVQKRRAAKRTRAAGSHRVDRTTDSWQVAPAGSALWREQSAGDGRPRDCYGIPWCGCWLRHQLGLADKRLNAVRSWYSVGQPSSKQVGAIAIIRPSHVGLVVGIAENGDPIIKSGNHNHRVATATYSARRVVAYRKL